MKEIYPERNREYIKNFLKIQAKVILARCPYAPRKSENLFGMRVQKFGGEWKRTWAFKINEESARREGYGSETTSGRFAPIAGYPGCPYCKSFSLAQCACGKSFCFKEDDEREFNGGAMRLTCPWCGKAGEYFMAEKLDLQGGGF